MELLKQIAIASLKTTMITITSNNPEFNINFPCVIPLRQIKLAKLGEYYNWPNTRSY